MTDKQLNEAVAKKLGLTIAHIAPTYLLVNEWADFHFKHPETTIPSFRPATDPAAAIWALERWDKEAFVYYSAERKHWMCVANYGKDHVGTFCGAICKAIVEAA